MRRQTRPAARTPMPKATAPTIAAGSHRTSPRAGPAACRSRWCAAVVLAGVTSAAANSAAVAKRSAGSFSSAVSTAVLDRGGNALGAGR